MTDRSRLGFVTIALALFWMTALAAPADAQSPQRTSPIYAVVFAFATDEAGDLVSFRVAKVSDTLAESGDVVDITVPERYVIAVRAAFLEKRRLIALESDPPKDGFAYYFYDPKQPDRADIEPRQRKK